MTTTTKTVQPTVYLMIGGSAIAFDERGEVLETVDFHTDGTPDWENAGGCDHRGGGGQEGFAQLHAALTLAEKNAVAVGFDIVHVAS